MTKNWKKFTAENFFKFFYIKNYNLPASIKDVQLQKKPTALKKEYPALKNMKFPNFFNFCPPGSGSGFWKRIRIRNPAYESIRTVALSGDSDYGEFHSALTQCTYQCYKINK